MPLSVKDLFLDMLYCLKFEKKPKRPEPTGTMFWLGILSMCTSTVFDIVVYT